MLSKPYRNSRANLDVVMIAEVRGMANPWCR